MTIVLFHFTLEFCLIFMAWGTAVYQCFSKLMCIRVTSGACEIIDSVAPCGTVDTQASRGDSPAAVLRAAQVGRENKKCA